MCRLERRFGGLAAIVAAGALSSAGTAAATEPQPYRYDAPIEIAKPAPFVELALPPAAYAHALQPEFAPAPTSAISWEAISSKRSEENLALTIQWPSSTGG